MKKLILSKRESFFRIAFYVFKWHINYLLKRNNKPLAIGVFLTNRCNLRCDMCTIWRSQNKVQLSMDDIKKILGVISPGCCYFSFSGGEPLLVKDVYDMIDYVSVKVPYVHLVSNGLLINAQAARQLAKTGLSEISLSLDGDEAYHNRLRGAGTVNSYQKVIQAIENLKRNAPKIRIVLNTVILPGYANQARYVVELAGKLKIYVKVQPVNQHFYFSDVSDMPGEIEFDKQDPRELSELIGYLLKTGYVLNSSFYLRNIIHYFARDSHCSLIRPRCYLPYYFLEVNPHRIVSPCMFGTGWGGGLTIEEYVKKDNRFTSLQKKLESCRRCDRSMYVCYWETMANIPLTNFIKYNFLKA